MYVTEKTVELPRRSQQFHYACINSNCAIFTIELGLSSLLKINLLRIIGIVLN